MCNVDEIKLDTRVSWKWLGKNHSSGLWTKRPGVALQRKAKAATTTAKNFDEFKRIISENERAGDFSLFISKLCQKIAQS